MSAANATGPRVQPARHADGVVELHQGGKKVSSSSSLNISRCQIDPVFTTVDTVAPAVSIDDGDAEVAGIGRTRGRVVYKQPQIGRHASGRNRSRRRVGRSIADSENRRVVAHEKLQF